MAYGIEFQDKFIELRVQGKSFDYIAEKMNISKPTLIKWNKELQKIIDEAIFEVRLQMKIELKIRRMKNAKTLINEIDKAYDALSKLNWNKQNAKDLLVIIEKLEERLSNLL